MKQNFLVTALVGLVATLALAGNSNLLANGDLSECKSLETLQAAGNKEDHTNVYKFAYAVGSSELGGWTVTRDQVFLTFDKRPGNRRWLDLNGGGGVKQSFDCPPKSMCVLKFRLEGNPQGPSEQTVSIAGPGLDVQESVSADKRRLVEVQFVPTSSPATVEIYATTSGRGPRIDRMSVEAL